MRKLIQFGAGNIGRSFIGQVFSRNGFEVVFADIDAAVIQELASRRSYEVVVKRSDGTDIVVPIMNVRGVDGRDLDAVTNEFTDTDYVATSVGKGALKAVIPVIAAGIARRFEHDPGAPPIDIIIAENIRSGAEYFRQTLDASWESGVPKELFPGLVETSIGKMVPIMREEDRSGDPLLVYAEEYNTLILDARGFRTAVPDFPEIHAVENILAYVDRKLFIHNLGHAACAYIGNREYPDARYIWEILEHPAVENLTRAAMLESAAALNAEYPEDLEMNDLEEHIEDLLERFANKYLGDTVFRVGRDLRRKLHRDDRIVGAALLARSHGLPFDAIAEVFRAALSFAAVDESGEFYPADAEFRNSLLPRGVRAVIREVCGLSPDVPAERDVITAFIER